MIKIANYKNDFLERILLYTYISLRMLINNFLSRKYSLYS